MSFIKVAQTRQREILSAIAQVEIQLTPEGLRLTAPNVENWEPDDPYAQTFSELPEAFAQDYLQLRLRNFLLDSFCDPVSENSDQADTEQADVEQLDKDGIANEGTLPILANNQVGGGLNVSLIQQFYESNQGQGYFDPGWQVLREEADGTLAVQKQGITVHVESAHHLRAHSISSMSVERPSEQTSARTEQRFVQSGDLVDILLPGYRYDTDVYIAISDLGPVVDIEQAIEIYFAANAAAMSPIMEAVTALHAQIPYTLSVPHRLSDYEGADAIALRIYRADYPKLRPVLQQIIQACNAPSLPEKGARNGQQSQPELRHDLPVFAYPLWPGISWADVIEGPVTQWFGSAADASRMGLVAEALSTQWMEMASAQRRLTTMQASFAAAELDWHYPYQRKNRAVDDLLHLDLSLKNSSSDNTNSQK